LLVFYYETYILLLFYSFIENSQSRQIIDFFVTTGLNSGTFRLCIVNFCV